LVEAGEQVRVLRNGKAIAAIVPVTADLPSWKRREANIWPPFGMQGVGPPFRPVRTNCLANATPTTYGILLSR